ncbi:Lrp/AsnC family transcriptional regulator [Candidatus Micrarchaeota archaeon]|nr:Lrp/AsnC family transcriptional regulator [Candidatus Micrarchaeota archaeon]MBU1930273.1 Lrp/AsnC family transcriptional regulator [Candidatus Micrarchaeota archaeon]
MSGFGLSEKDSLILSELYLNARVSLTELARRVRLSKQAVSYRLNYLEQNKVIEGYYAITNAYALGKTHYSVFVKYQNMSSEKEEEFMNYLSEHPMVVWTAYFNGDLDAAFLVWADNIREFEKVFDDINQKFGVFFQEKQFSIATKIEYLKFAFSKEKKETTSLVFGNCFERYSLDALSKSLLLALNKNGRASLVELANKLGSSPKVIKEKMSGLIKKKIIIGFNVKINHRLLGLTHYKILLKLNDVSQEIISKLSTYLKRQSNVIFLVKPIGNHDFEFELLAPSNEVFHNTIKELRSAFSKEIKSYNTIVHYYEPKAGQLFSF